MVTSDPKVQTIRALRGGQMTIPVEIRRELGIDDKTLLDVQMTEDGGFVVHPVEVVVRSKGSPWLRDLYEAFAPVRQEAIDRGYTESEINEWIDEAIQGVRAERKHARDE